MPRPEIKITGKKAVVLLVIVVLFAFLQGRAARATIPTEGADELRMELVSEYISAGLPALEQAMAANDVAAVEGLTEEILSRDRVIFRSIEARGSFGNVVVRVEIQVDGGAPPVGDRIRYFGMRHSPTVGWIVEYETFALAYYLKFF